MLGGNVSSRMRFSDARRSMTPRSGSGGANAGVRFHRIKSQLNKKWRDGSHSDILGAVQSEIGWPVIIALAVFLILGCYGIVYLATRDNGEYPDVHNIPHAHSSQELGNIGGVDPEHWNTNIRRGRQNHPNVIKPHENVHLPGDDNPHHYDPQHDSKNLHEDIHQNTHQDTPHIPPPKEIPPVHHIGNAKNEVKLKNQGNKEDDHRVNPAAHQENVHDANSLFADIQVDFSNLGTKLDESEAQSRAYQIKQSTLHAWHGYAKRAMGHDEIKPVSAMPGDSWGGLGATMIDSLDTMMMMGLKDELKEAIEKLKTIDFGADLRVSFFETTIRHLGGLLGAHNVALLNHEEEAVFLEKATALAKHLLPTFRTARGLPKSLVNLKTEEIGNYGWTRDRSIIAEVGSFFLEFYTVSYFSKDPTFQKHAADVLQTLRGMTKAIPGLYSRYLATDAAEFPQSEQIYSVGGMADSFYEYLLKLWILTDYQEQDSLAMYVESMDAINSNLLRRVVDKTKREEPYFFYGEMWYNKLRGRSEELTCFMPGLLSLGVYHIDLRFKQVGGDVSKLPKAEQELYKRRNDHLKLSHLLVETCAQLYFTTTTGLAAESIQFDPDNGGWSIKEPRYQLRPETLESLYIMYMVTHREVYREWGWKIYQAIETHCKTSDAYTGLTDVRDEQPNPDDKMESFVMAETWKYLFLMFDTPAQERYSLKNGVFNTEAHYLPKVKPLQLEKQAKN